MGVLFARRMILMTSILCSFAASEFITIPEAAAQDDWSANDAEIEARKIERYMQLAEQSPEKSYAFNRLMAAAGKGAAYRELLATYEKKAAANPGSFNLAMLLGHMHAYGGQTAEALAAYRKALAIKRTPLAQMSIAAAERENRNYDEATAAYEAALELKPTKTERQEIWRALAEIAIYRRDMARARTCFAKLIEIEPNSVFARRELAQIYAENRMYAEARGVLEEASKLSSASANDREQLTLEIGALHETEGNDEAALALYAQTSSKLSAGHWMQRELSSRMIDIYRRHGRVCEMTAELEKKWTSPTYEQRLELADLYDECGEAQKAEAQLKKAISSGGKRTEAREKFVDFYRSHGKISQMHEARRDLIKSAPDVFDYRYALYEAYIRDRQIDKAIGVLDEAAKSFSNDFDALHQLAQAYQNHGYGAKALAIYESWAKKHPSDIEALEILGSAYDGEGQKQKALQTWQKIEKAPVDANIKIETLARIYDEHGMIGKAQALYEKHAQSNPKDCGIQMQYADVLTRSRNYDKALDAYEAAALMCPTAAAQTACARNAAQIIESRSSARKALTQYRGKIEQSGAGDAALGAKVLYFARLAAALKTPETAIEPLERYLASHEDDFAARSALVEAARAAGNPGKAREALDGAKALTEADKRGIALATAEIDLAEGKLEAAKMHFEDALKLDGNDAETHERLGDVLMQMRAYRDAANVYETAYRIDPKNYAVAMKQATCLSILARNDEANALYIEIASHAGDETLAMKAAQRAIDDMSWQGTLDAMAQTFLPLLRSKQRKNLYLEILLKIADAQVRPHILALETRDGSQLYGTRHEIRALADKYSQAIVEGLLSDDVSISAQAMALTSWLSSSAVIMVLGQKLEQNSGEVLEKAQQMQAIRAIAHARLPAAASVLSACLHPTKTRAVREHALWGLGLIASPEAASLLRDHLTSSIDSFRALAVIGLGRQGVYFDEIAKRLEDDPSPMVKSAAAWMLAYRKRGEYKDLVLKTLSENDSKPHIVWALVGFDEENSIKHLTKALWRGTRETRAMAQRILFSQPRDIDLMQMTPSEILGTFIKSDSSHYMSNVNLDVLLEDFARQAMTADASDAAQSELAFSRLLSGEKEVASAISSIAQSPDASASDEPDPKMRVLQDLASRTSPLKLASDSGEVRAFVTRMARSIEPQLEQWTDADQSPRAPYAMRLYAMTDSGRSAEKLARIAQGDGAVCRRMQAAEALGLSRHERARAYLRELSLNPDGMIRAAAVSQLDPSNREDAAILEKAARDPYVAVARMAQLAQAGSRAETAPAER